MSRYSDEYSIPPELLLAVICIESGFHPEAQSAQGARGLTQIIPETFAWLQTKTNESYHEDALFDENISIRYGALLLHLLLEEFPDPKTTLAAYHAGRGQVNQWLQQAEFTERNEKKIHIIPFPKTRHYVEKVMKAYQIYQKKWK